MHSHKLRLLFFAPNKIYCQAHLSQIHHKTHGFQRYMVFDKWLTAFSEKLADRHFILRIFYPGDGTLIHSLFFQVTFLLSVLCLDNCKISPSPHLSSLINQSRRLLMFLLSGIHIGCKIVNGRIPIRLPRIATNRWNQPSTIRSRINLLIQITYMMSTLLNGSRLLGPLTGGKCFSR